MEDFMLGALGNQKVFLLKLHAGVQNLGSVKESYSRDTTWPLCIEHFIHMSAQVKLPVKKKIHWKGFIKLLSLHSIQMYNWPRNLTLEDGFLLDYSHKDTTFCDALWVACQDDSMHQLGLRHLPSGTDVLVVDESGHMLLTVAQGMAFGTRKRGHEGVEPENESSHHCRNLTNHPNPTSISPAPTVPSTFPKSHCHKRGDSCCVQ